MFVTKLSSDSILKELGLEWQIPVKTEWIFASQNIDDPRSIPIPWATVIDKGCDLQRLALLIKQYFNKKLDYFTCCQHISWKRLIPFFKIIGIHTLYASHRTHEDTVIDGITIKSCPLYAVNYEDQNRNEVFKGVDFLNLKRKYLFSFIGAYNPSCYMSDIRKRILSIKSTDKILIRDSGAWHFEQAVYHSKQGNQQYTDPIFTNSGHKNTTDEYNRVLLNSNFSLCPSGSGPNSIRFWESLAVGSIPVVLSDNLTLPNHPLWSQAIVCLPESKLEKIESTLNNFSAIDVLIMRRNCLMIYKDLSRWFKGYSLNRQDIDKHGNLLMEDKYSLI